MGCDIHVHVEIKVAGKWLHYNHPRVDRHYRLFAKLANVRNSEEYEIGPISLPKGFPGDATQSTKFDYVRDLPNAHSTSWLSSHEIVDVELWFEKEGRYSGEEVLANCFSRRFGYIFGNSFHGFYAYPEHRPAGLEDFRFIFWFDN